MFLQQSGKALPTRFCCIAGNAGVDNTPPADARQQGRPLWSGAQGIVCPANTLLTRLVHAREHQIGLHS